MSSILIIGAGASGLMAATELIDHKHTVTVVEARDRIGGRIHTLQGGFSFPAEAGAEFIHGRQPLTLALAKKSKSELLRVSGNHYQLFNGEVEEGDFLEDEWTLLENELRKLRVDTDIGSFMDEHFPAGKYYTLRKRVKGYVEGFDVGDIHRVSALALRKEWSEADESHQYHIHGGYRQLLDYLSTTFVKKGGTIHQSSVIHEIGWSKGKVTALTEDGRAYTAEKIVVTVPVGVMQKGAIRFSPPLPEQSQAISSLGFGGVIKFLIEFEAGFWEDISNLPFHDLSMVVSDQAVPTWWTQRPGKIPLLTGWLGGPPAGAISHDPDVLRATAIRSLHRIFKYSEADINAAIRVFRSIDWVRDSFSAGGYSYSTVASDAAVKLLKVPVMNTIYFAGEGIYTGNAMGTVEAAFASGKDVAAACSKTF